MGPSHSRTETLEGLSLLSYKEKANNCNFKASLVSPDYEVDDDGGGFKSLLVPKVSIH